jgi:hypothetical protein
MSNKKQTAVEWLIQKLTNRQNGVFDGFPYLSVDEIYDKAKEIEKEQIKSAFNIGELMAHDYFYGNDECAENYFNETYGGNK